jgi:hypothetical protein
MTRREYQGGAQTAYLTASLGGSTGDLTIPCDNLTNWPTGTGGKPFFIVIDRGLASEEKILCVSRSGNTLTVFNDGITVGRGEDGTTVTSHAANAAVEHVFTATDADEANAHVNSSTDVHGLAGGAAVVGTTSTQTLTNKTLTNPTINGATFSGTIEGIEVGLNPFFLIGA